MRKPYPTDLTDAQWARIAPAFQQVRGRPRRVPARELLNAIFYFLRNGGSWRCLPHDFPSWRTVFSQMCRWTKSGTLQAAQSLLQCDQHEPSVGLIDSTFIESAFGGAHAAPSGYKRATGHSLHVLISKHSAVLGACVLPANRPDTVGAQALLPAVTRTHPSLTTLLGDKAYRGKPLQAFAQTFGVCIDASSPALPKGTIFQPMPLRWKVERFFAWFAKWRRVAKNFCFSLQGFTREVNWVLLGVSLRNKSLQYTPIKL